VQREPRVSPTVPPGLRHVGDLRIAASLPDAVVLAREQDFRVRFTDLAMRLYDAREGCHDDLLALALVVFGLSRADLAMGVQVIRAR